MQNVPCPGSRDWSCTGQAGKVPLFRHYMKVSGQLHSPADLSSDKLSSVHIARKQNAQSSMVTDVVKYIYC
jgi:hypothetical protein